MQPAHGRLRVFTTVPPDGIVAFELTRTTPTIQRPRPTLDSDEAGYHVFEPHDPTVSELSAEPSPGDYATYAMTMIGYCCPPATSALVAALVRSLNHRWHRRIEIRRLERALARPALGFGCATGTHNSP